MIEIDQIGSKTQETEFSQIADLLIFDNTRYHHTPPLPRHPDTAISPKNNTPRNM